MFEALASDVHIDVPSPAPLMPAGGAWRMSPLSPASSFSAAANTTPFVIDVAQAASRVPPPPRREALYHCSVRRQHTVSHRLHELPGVCYLHVALSLTEPLARRRYTDAGRKRQRARDVPFRCRCTQLQPRGA